MKKAILFVILAILIGNTKIYVEDYKFIEHYDTNEICISLFDKIDVFVSIKGIEMVEN